MGKTVLSVVLLISMTMLSCTYLINEKIFLGEENAREILKTALAEHNCDIPTNNVIDSISFVNVIEHSLFNIYSKENILREKPYEIYHFDRYWVARGTLQQISKGGTFEGVLDVQKNRIIYRSCLAFYCMTDFPSLYV